MDLTSSPEGRTGVFVVVGNWLAVALGRPTKAFTLPELRQFFEFMLDESIDRGNFRRRISELISFGALTDLGETRSEGRGRPAELYRLDSNRLRRFLDTEEKK